jgi:hypothetical protein
VTKVLPSMSSTEGPDVVLEGGEEGNASLVRAQDKPTRVLEAQCEENRVNPRVVKVKEGLGVEGVWKVVKERLDLRLMACPSSRIQTFLPNLTSGRGGLGRSLWAHF